MKPVEQPVPTTSLAGMLAAVSCRLDRDAGGWNLRLSGFDPGDAVELATDVRRTYDITPSVRMLGADATGIRARSRDDLLRVGGNVLRNHVRSRLDARQCGVTAPETDFMHHLLARSGAFAIRPIETEVYSTWVDVGISTSPDAAEQPADLSLIYDLVSNTWHADF
ncbi:MAG TPA: hypothetical protein DEO57_02105 [Phycisphaerales bacterium]|nr:hypothetical protein [Phycisphaerales bacterium]|tara:strand:+ start:180 stop:677 length:498 start_codon:yes stop_codon:yes gene_type:complete